MALLKLTQLSAIELILFIQAWFNLAKWHYLIAYRPYEKWYKSLDFESSNVQNNQDNKKLISNVVSLSEKAARNHLVKMNCLRRCLSQKELLKNRGIKSTLHIGVKITDDQLFAHSWLSVNDRVINDSEEVIGEYTEITQKEKENVIQGMV